VERLLAAVGALAPLVEAERARLDRDRLLPTRLVDALVAADELEPGWRARSCSRARRSACCWRRSTTCGGRCGAGAVLEDAGLEPRFRDVHVATQHVAAGPPHPGGSRAAWRWVSTRAVSS